MSLHSAGSHLRTANSDPSASRRPLQHPGLLHCAYAHLTLTSAPRRKTSHVFAGSICSPHCMPPHAAHFCVAHRSSEIRQTVKSSASLMLIPICCLPEARSFMMSRILASVRGSSGILSLEMHVSFR